MEKFKYSKEQQEMNNVLKYQYDQLKEMLIERSKSANQRETEIEVLEAQLRQLGIDPSSVKNKPVIEYSSKSIIVMPSWEQLCAEAEAAVGNNCKLEDIFTEVELQSNHEYLKNLRKEYNQIHKLDKFDISIAALAGIVAGAVDILLVGIPQRSKDGMKAGTLSNYIRSYFDKILPPDEMEKLANSKESKVPFDAQDNRNTTIRVIDIMTGRMTTIDKKGKIVSQTMENYADRIEPNIFKAFAKELTHLKSDVTTSMGLPAPLMSLFNLLQFGV